MTTCGDDCTANDDATRGRLYCVEVPKHVVDDCTANDYATRGDDCNVDDAWFSEIKGRLYCTGRKCPPNGRE